VMRLIQLELCKPDSIVTHASFLGFLESFAAGFKTFGVPFGDCVAQAASFSTSNVGPGVSRF
jgi:hypothetical protein